MKEFINATIIAHRLKDKPLGVIKCGPLYRYDQLNDKGWQQYKTAREIISKYKLLEKMLVWFNWI